MAEKLVHALNTVSGKVGLVTPFALEDVAFGKVCVQVPEGTKDYDSRFWKSTDAKGHKDKVTTQAKFDRMEDSKAQKKAEETTSES